MCIRDRDGTEYVLAAIPLGGYVRMLDEREDEVPAQQLYLAFNRKPVLQRIAIVAAGPLDNLVLAFGLLWAMLVIGRPDYAPVVGQATAIAAQAGLQPGDQVPVSYTHLDVYKRQPGQRCANCP